VDHIDMNNLLYERLIASQAAAIEQGYTVQDIVVDKAPDPYFIIDGKKVLGFCSNNYLGLSYAPQVLSAARDAVATHGIGTADSRSLGGNLAILERLEQELADVKSKESGIVFATGMLANVGVIPALLAGAVRGDKENGPVIIGDHLNHKSIVMGCELSRATFFRYRHNDLQDLERLLRENASRPLLIVTDAVFSMDGDLAHLPEICKLAEQFGALLMIDDAHGTGVLGHTGKGTAEHFGVSSHIDVSMGTLSKAVGGMGGFVACDKKLASAIRHNCDTYFFTSTLPPEQAAGALAALDLMKDDRLRKKLWQNAFAFHQGIREIGLRTTSQWTHIVPILIGDEHIARKVEAQLLSDGLYVSAVTYPAVGRGKARLRFSMSAMHTEQDVAFALELLARASKNFHLPLEPMQRSEARDHFLAHAPAYLNYANLRRE
jgi:8-amino-7-oxononanoate synthase